MEAIILLGPVAATLLVRVLVHLSEVRGLDFVAVGVLRFRLINAFFRFLRIREQRLVQFFFLILEPLQQLFVGHLCLELEMLPVSLVESSSISRKIVRYGSVISQGFRLLDLTPAVI